MTSTIRRATAGVLILGLTAGTALSGCSTIERETGLSKETQTGAGIGAASGGVIAAIAGANPAWIAASVILGGVTGGAIGEYLHREDAQKAASNQYSSLEMLGTGETRNWNNPETGAYGSTRVNRTYRTAEGTLCKSFTETIHTADRSVTETATACKAPSGSWRVSQG